MEAHGADSLSEGERARVEAVRAAANARRGRDAAAAVGSLGGSLLDALVDVGLSGAGAERQHARRAKARADAQAARLALFAPELALFGIRPEAAGALDTRTLRSRYRERSRVLHPDLNPAREGVDPADFGGVEPPSIQELNRAYEALKMMLEV